MEKVNMFEAAAAFWCELAANRTWKKLAQDCELEIHLPYHFKTKYYRLIEVLTHGYHN